MSELEIEVQERKETGSSVSRRLRAAGNLPAVVYGGGKESVPIVVDRKTVAEMLRQSGGANAVLLLKMAGTDKVIVFDGSYDNINLSPSMADLLLSLAPEVSRQVLASVRRATVG